MAATLVKDTNFNMRINKQKKTSIEELYENLGMTLIDVRVSKYNKETIAAINEARDIMSGKVETKSYSSAKELFDEFDAE